jgi:hypothetical protein
MGPTLAVCLVVSMVDSTVVLMVVSMVDLMDAVLVFY